MRLKHKIYYIAIGVISSMKKIRFILCLTLAVILFQTVSLAGVKEYVILDENVDAVLKYLTLGDGTPKKVTDAYAGKEALYINGAGSYGGRANNAAPWSWYCSCFKITENPKADDEFRYITFAWKKNGGTGIQLQLHGNPDTWGHRYHAGANVKNWNPSIQVDKKIPEKWEVHTRDLIEDWKDLNKGGQIITGIAFTAWDGKAGLWDHVVFHQTPEDPLAPQAVDVKAKLAVKWGEVKQ